jgi:hypothetical protein
MRNRDAAATLAPRYGDIGNLSDRHAAPFHSIRSSSAYLPVEFPRSGSRASSIRLGKTNIEGSAAMNAYRQPRHRTLGPSPAPADERRPLPLETDFDGSRRPETHASTPQDPDRYREIFCGGTD